MRAVLRLPVAIQLPAGRNYRITRSGGVVREHLITDRHIAVVVVTLKGLKRKGRNTVSYRVKNEGLIAHGELQRALGVAKACQYLWLKCPGSTAECRKCNEDSGKAKREAE